MTYQEEQALLPLWASPFCLATVQGVYTDGLTLLFPGEDEASGKRFCCSSQIKFSAGDRVLLAKVSGTYVAICPIAAD